MSLINQRAIASFEKLAALEGFQIPSGKAENKDTGRARI